MSTHPLILQLDVAGNPVEWIDFEKAAYYYTKGLVAWAMGQDGYTIYGGKSRMTGARSFLDFSTIIAIEGQLATNHIHRTPTLSNTTLFRRDQHICAYCGDEFQRSKLTRDHIHPKSRGGRDRWENVVTACGGCNKVKDDRTPEEASMKLIYVPYIPNQAENLILNNRTILTDQMEFLKSKVTKDSRILNPIKLN